MSHVTWPRPFQGWFVINRLWVAMFNSDTKFELSTITATKIWKASPNVKKILFWGDLWVTHMVHLWLHGKCIVDFLLVIIELYSLVLTAAALLGEICLLSVYLILIGMNDAGLQTVFRAVVVSKLMYASPAWRGFATATDLKRVDAFLRRCKRCRYCSSDLPDFEELLDESDDRLFCKILNNSTHTLHTLLPPQSIAPQYYHLRRRNHDRQLPTQTSHLRNKTFITRALYKDCYWTCTFNLYA